MVDRALDVFARGPAEKFGDGLLEAVREPRPPTLLLRGCGELGKLLLKRLRAHHRAVEVCGDALLLHLRDLHRECGGLRVEKGERIAAAGDWDDAIRKRRAAILRID